MTMVLASELRWLSLRLRALAELAAWSPPARFMPRAVALIRAAMDADTSVWGLGQASATGGAPHFCQWQTQGLEACFAQDWRGLAAEDAFFARLSGSPGQAQGFGPGREAAQRSAAMAQFAQRHGLSQGLGMGIAAPLGAQSLFLVLYRRGRRSRWDAVSRLRFELLVQHAVQAWRFNLQPVCAAAGLSDLHGAAIYAGDGRLIAAGAALCQAVHGAHGRCSRLPPHLLAQAGPVPVRLRCGEATVQLERAAGHPLLRLAPSVPAGGHGQTMLAVAQLFAQGCTHKEIAATTGLSPATVRTYVQRTYERLQVHSRTALAAVLARRRP